MNKGRIIYIAVLLAVLGAFYGVYQFYLKEKLETYKQDEQLKESLEKTYENLSSTFFGVKPEDVVRAWRLQEQPWQDAVEERAKFFNFGGWFAHEMPPKEGVILKIWYEETSNKMVWDLYQKVGEKFSGQYNLFPTDIRTDLGVPTASDWAGQNVTPQLVNISLGKLAFGINLCQMLLDAKVTSVRSMILWPQRTDKEYANLLNMQTVGLSFTIAAKDLVSFLEEDLRLADRYFSVEALKLSYCYIAYPNEPQIDVEMLLTQAAFVPPKDAPGAVPVATQGARDVYDEQNADRPGGGRAGRPGQQMQQEPGFFGKAWKLFKRYVLYTN